MAYDRCKYYPSGPIANTISDGKSPSSGHTYHIPHLPRAALPGGAFVILDRSGRSLREIKTRAASGKCQPAPQAGYFVPSTIIVSSQQKSYGMRWKCPSTLFSASCSLLLISQRRPSAKRMMNAIPMLPTSPAKHFALPFGRKLKMLKISTPRMATNKYDGTTKRAGPKTYPISNIIFPRCRAKWEPALRGMSHPAPSASYGAVDGAKDGLSTAKTYPFCGRWCVSGTVYRRGASFNSRAYPLPLEKKAEAYRQLFPP